MPGTLLELLANAAIPLKLTLKVALTATGGACLCGVGGLSSPF